MTDPADTVRDYYEALRRGEPLAPYFLEHPDVVKVGVGERLVGADAVAEGLREQTRTTTDWRVESRDLRVVDRDDHAAVADLIRLGWRDTAADVSYDFPTRWSGTLTRQPVDSTDPDEAATEWLFAGLHVSAPVATGDDADDATDDVRGSAGSTASDDAGGY